MRLYIGLVLDVPHCDGNPTFSIFQGDALTMRLKAAGSWLGADPLDLTGATEIVVKLPKADGTILELKLTAAQVSVVSGPLGKFDVTISAVNSALLLVGVYQTFDVTFTLASGAVVTVAFEGSLSVYQVS